MTIANGSLILPGDLGAALTTAQANIRSDNRVVGLGHHLAFRFVNVVSGTPFYAREARFSVPTDSFLEAFAVQTSNATGSTTALLTALRTNAANETVTAVDPPLEFMGIQSIVTNAGSGLTAKGSRIVLDNRRDGRVKGTELYTNPVFRTLPKGARMSLVVSTTNTIATFSGTLVVLCLRTRYERT